MVGKLPQWGAKVLFAVVIWLTTGCGDSADRTTTLPAGDHRLQVTVDPLLDPRGNGYAIAIVHTSGAAATTAGRELARDVAGATYEIRAAGRPCPAPCDSALARNLEREVARGEVPCRETVPVANDTRVTVLATEPCTIAVATKGLVSVPDLAGTGSQRAARALRALELEPRPQFTTRCPRPPQGDVAVEATRPSAGARARLGGTVTLLLGCRAAKSP